MLDRDGYPTEEALKTIKNADLTKIPIRTFLDYVGSNWKYADDGFILKGKKVLKLELHTCGWSGNEDVIEALKENRFFFMLYWEKTVRGGHYYFTIKPIDFKKGDKVREDAV